MAKAKAEHSEMAGQLAKVRSCLVVCMHSSPNVLRRTHDCKQ